MFFRVRGAAKGPLFKGHTPGEKFLRALLLIGVFAVAGWGFWLNSEVTLNNIQSRGAVWDETGLLQEDEKQGLRAMAARFTAEHGINVRMQLCTGKAELPRQAPRTLYIVISPEHKQVLIDFPPLLHKALGDEFMDWLQNTHFVPYFAQEQWGIGLADALKAIWQRLAQ